MAGPVEVLDAVFVALTQRQWNWERTEDGIQVTTSNLVTDFFFNFVFDEGSETFLMTCAFSLESHDEEIARLITLMNFRTRFGHLVLEEEAGVIMWRYGLPLPGNTVFNVCQCEELINQALQNCDICYKAMKFIEENQMSAQGAMEMASFPTQGNA
ncbi:YbjN domain-containing protein [Candidatus Parcubacteria bacterium]|nr:YbjN domain-containing protein [Candidatus Parcubacteria bacterium]